MTPQDTELVAALAAVHVRLRDWLRHVFPRLRDEAEDILQDAITETLHRVRTEGFRPQAGWYAYLRWLAKQRALDRLRCCERRVFHRLSLGSPAEDSDCATAREDWRHGPVDPRPVPSQSLEEAERRGRQGLLLSNVLQQFCHWCESRPERGRIKEAYERSLRGQPPAQIATAMGLAPAEVYTLLNQARNWVVERIRQTDVDRSVFLTLHRRKAE